jgi:hypothetical protein
LPFTRVCTLQPAQPEGVALLTGKAMDVIKSVVFGAIVSAAIAMVIGSQGTSAGPLAIHLVSLGDMRLFWSWPLFLSGTGLFFALSLMQR